MSDVGTIHHRFPSLKADLVDATKVRPSNWNDTLILAGGVNGQVAVRDTLQADGWGWALPTDLVGLVPATRTVNGHALSADVVVTKADVGLGNVENTALSTGNAGSATLAAAAIKLATARAINGVAFDGTADITVPAAAGTLTGATLAAGVTASSLTSVGTLATLTVTAAIVGSVTGNAATATALQNARTINGTSFDGTANITVTAAAGTLTGGTLAAGVLASSLTSVGTLGGLTVTAPITGSITGNAGSATILQTTRAINGVNFNGSADITVPAAAGTLTGTTLAAGILGANQNWTALQTFGLGATVNGGALNLVGTQEFIWTGRTILSAVQNGQLRIRNNARTAGSILKCDALPTIASGFGTSPSITAESTALAGSVNVGTGGTATSGVINFNGTAFAAAPFVVAMNTTTGAIVRATATTTQLTITAAVAFIASDVIAWICIGPHQ